MFHSFFGSLAVIVFAGVAYCIILVAGAEALLAIGNWSKRCMSGGSQ